MAIAVDRVETYPLGRSKTVLTPDAPSLAKICAQQYWSDYPCSQGPVPNPGGAILALRSLTDLAPGFRGFGTDYRSGFKRLTADSSRDFGHRRYFGDTPIAAALSLLFGNTIRQQSFHKARPIETSKPVPEKIKMPRIIRLVSHKILDIIEGMELDWLRRLRGTWDINHTNLEARISHLESNLGQAYDIYGKPRPRSRPHPR